MESTIITCTNCGFSKDVPTDKLPQNPVKITCPKCKKSFAYTPIHKDQDFTFQSDPEPTINSLPSDMQKCSNCGGEIKVGAIKCKHCKSDLVHNIAQPSAPLTQNKHIESGLNDVIYCIEAIKSSNTPCLWVSLDYWNLYFTEDKVVAVRCYRGKWGIIGFIIGLFLAIVGFTIVGALGILLDKTNGEAKCKTLSNNFKEIMRHKNSYTIIEAQLSDISSADPSDLCLGNLWLKYMIKISGQKLYFESARYDQINDAIKKL